MRTAVITGGSSGIGLAVARLLARRGGWRIVLAARDEARLAAASAPLGAVAVRCDVCSDDDVSALAAASLAEGGCDLLVQSAGVPGRAGVLAADEATYRRVMETNYIGLVRVATALWPQLAERRGRIAHVVSVAGTIAIPSAAPYCASKHAAIAYSRALASAGRRHGVSVTVVNPGPVPTTGFPQTELVRNGLLRLLTVDADRCADRLMRAVDRGASEVFVPQWWRAASALAGIAPGLATRVAGRASSRARTAATGEFA